MHGVDFRTAVSRKADSRGNREPVQLPHELRMRQAPGNQNGVAATAAGAEEASFSAQSARLHPAPASARQQH